MKGKRITVSIIFTFFVLIVLSSLVSCDNIFVIAILNNKVHVKTSGNGTASATPDYAENGRFISLTAAPGDGYLFDRWVVESGSAMIQNVYANPGAFSMPSGVVTVRAVFEEINKFFLVIVEDDGNGTGKADASPAHIEREVVITAFSNDGYVFDKWEIISGDIEILDRAENPAVFIMPAEDVIVKATFKEIIHNAYATSVVFNDVIYGYNQPDPHTMTLHNVGEYSFSVLSIALGGTDTDKFILNSNISNIGAGSEESFTIQPKAGLNVGEYTAEIVITISGLGEIIEPVSFTVIKKALTLTLTNISRTSLTPLSGETSLLFIVNVTGLVGGDTAAVICSAVPTGLLLNSGGAVNIGTNGLVYNGATAFANPAVTLNFTASASSNYSFSNGTTVPFNLNVYDGQVNYTGTAGTYDRRIPVNSGNISVFNTYANTVLGLTRHYKLVQNVTLPAVSTGSNWTAIGNSISGSVTQFTGSFDGQSYTIANLTIRISSVGYNSNTDNYSSGMFGYIGANSVVQNLVLTNCYIDSYAGGGAIACENRGTVQYCSSTGDIYGNGYPLGVCGGIVRHNYGIVQNCNATGNVRGYTAGGGIVASNMGLVQNCSATVVSVRGVYTAGGIAGQNNSGRISNCYTTGTVDGGRAGGIVGQNDGTVENCYATGAVSGVSGSYTVGGIAGTNYSGSTVRNCYASGNIDGNSSTATDNSVGGIVGYNESGSTVEKCYATGNVTGRVYTGGVVGRNAGSVTYCVGLSKEVRTASTTNANVGRVVGINNTGGTHTYNSARSDMTIRYNTNTVYNPTVINFSSKDGYSISHLHYYEAYWWYWDADYGFWSNSIWEFRNNYLPILRNMPQGTQNPTVN
ncbi:MAG: hypothetical protein FWB95_09475 [Treponema sp.]|nr:hypothetical protein [Treponema sp.]